jgi:hypothetical protein
MSDFHGIYPWYWGPYLSPHVDSEKRLWVHELEAESIPVDCENRSEAEIDASTLNWKSQPHGQTGYVCGHGSSWP